MYRFLVVVASGLALTACASADLDFLKPAPQMDTLRFESEPPGAEAKTSTGQSCRTPCALAVEANAALTVTFSLNGFQSESVSVELVGMGDGTTKLRPNPVMVQLKSAGPPPKKKPTPRKPGAKKPAAKPAAAKPAAAKPAAAAPAAQQTGTSPWPGPPTAPSR